MKKDLYISLLFCFISCSTLYSQKTNVEINKEYQRIENSKNLIIDSLSLIRGIDFSRGDNADEKKYKIFRKRKKIIKMEYEEINNGYRKWQIKTSIYFKNNIPFFIIERDNGEMTLYTSNGEISKPYKKMEEIYVYNWNSERIKRVYNGHDAIPQMKLCKIYYEELIEKIKLEFKSK